MSTIEPTDEQLISRIREGDGEAERLLYERYKQLVRSRAHSYFLIGADHEDLVQEGMLGLYKAVCDKDGTQRDENNCNDRNVPQHIISLSFNK